MSALEVMQSAFAMARAGDLALLDLVDAGAPVNAQNQKGDTLLMLASYHGHAELVRGLLARGADAELANDRGQTPLLGVAFKGDLATALALLDGGALVDGADAEGKTALTWAVLFRRQDVAALLRSRGADEQRLHWALRLW